MTSREAKLMCRCRALKRQISALERDNAALRSERENVLDLRGRLQLSDQAWQREQLRAREATTLLEEIQHELLVLRNKAASRHDLVELLKAVQWDSPSEKMDRPLAVIVRSANSSHIDFYTARAHFAGRNFEEICACYAAHHVKTT